MKNFHSENLKRKFNIFQLINFCNCRILSYQLYICNILYLQKNIEPHVFALPILQFIWQDLVIACRSFNRRKTFVLIIGI